MFTRVRPRSEVRGGMYRLWLKVKASLQGMNISQCTCVCVFVQPWALCRWRGLTRGSCLERCRHWHQREMGKCERKRKIGKVHQSSHTYLLRVCFGRSTVSRSVSTLQDIQEVLDEPAGYWQWRRHNYSPVETQCPAVSFVLIGQNIRTWFCVCVCAGWYRRCL